MKRQLILFFILSLGTIHHLQAQSVSPFVLTAGGEYSSGNGISLSWTLGETITATAQGGGNTLTQGFQQPEISDGALPVSILDFKVVRTNRYNVTLKWRTASESNHEGFDIERRLENEPAFIQRGSVASQAVAGNSLAELAYTYVDPNSFDGISYYRQKQSDMDGRSSYTLIRAVSGTGNTEVNLSVFPNPNNGRFKITIEGSTGSARVFITDINGRIVRKLNIMNSEPAWVGNLLPGVYFVSIPDVFGAGRSFSEKVVVGK